MSADRKTLTQQMLGLARLPITTDVTVKGSRLSWIGEIQPTPLSVTYVVRIGYGVGRRAPAVTVVSPDLRDAATASLPHVYAEDRLCLCYPWQWDDGKLIVRTVLPWAAEWLLHYEIWKITDKWHGGGHEPAVAVAR